MHMHAHRRTHVHAHTLARAGAASCEDVLQANPAAPSAAISSGETSRQLYSAEAASGLAPLLVKLAHTVETLRAEMAEVRADQREVLACVKRQRSRSGMRSGTVARPEARNYRRVASAHGGSERPTTGAVPTDAASTTVLADSAPTGSSSTPSALRPCVASTSRGTGVSSVRQLEA